MTNPIVVAHRSQRVERLAMALALLLWGFVLTVDLLAVWLLDMEFTSYGNLKFVLFLVFAISACGLYQYRRLSGSGEKVARVLGADLVSLEPKDEAWKRYRNVATEVAIAAGVRMPMLFVMKRSPEINAFAAGRPELGTAIAVTQGALDKLTRDELQGLVAHEMAHLKHQDIDQTRWLAAGLFGLVCFALFGGIILLVAGKAAGGSKEGAGAAIALGMIGLVIAALGAMGWFAAAVIDSAASREMEFRADADAVRMVSNSDGLVGVLIKISQETSAFPSDIGDLVQSVNPMFFRSGATGFSFSTHPPLLDRIRALDPGKAAELQMMMGR